MMRRIYKLVTWAFIPLFLYLLNSCGKCRDKDRIVCDVPQSYFDYFEVFKEGNWWTYINQDSSKADSLYVTSNTRDGIRNGTIDGGCNDGFSINYSIISEYLVANVTPGFRPYNGISSFGNLCGDIRYSCNAPSAQLTLWNFDQNLKTEEIKKVEGRPTFILDSLISGGEIYLQVLYTASFANLGGDSIAFWFAPNKGIVQYTVKPSGEVRDTFRLVNSFVK